MYERPEFVGDENKKLKEAQRNLYPEIAIFMFRICRKKLIFAATLLDQKVEVVDRAGRIEEIGLYALLDSYGIIAARYRYTHDDGMQIPLLEDEKSVCDYEYEWRIWAKNEIEELSNIPTFVGGVINAVVFEGTTVGDIGENQIGNFLIMHYGMKDWALKDGCVSFFSAST